MYAPPAFAVDDPTELSRFVGAHPFALLATNGEAGPLVAHAPLIGVTDGEGRLVELVGHLARANPFWKAAQGAPVLAVFGGADAYVSPAYYPSKAVHGRVVPTWNYLRVEVRGAVEVETDPTHMAAYVQTPTDALEASRAAPWMVSDAPANYVAQLSRAIVGLRLRVSAVEGVFKLSQNKNAADHGGVLSSLSSSPNPKDRAVAEAMAQARMPA